MDKGLVVCRHNGSFFSHKEEWRYIVCRKNELNERSMYWARITTQGLWSTEDGVGSFNQRQALCVLSCVPNLVVFSCRHGLLPFFLLCVISLDGRKWVPVFASFLLPPAEGFCPLISIEMGFKSTLTYENMKKETQCRAEENIHVLN